MNVELEYDSDDEDACGAAFAGGPVASRIINFLKVLSRKHTTNIFIRSMAFRDKNRYLVPGEFVIARGVK